MQKNVGCRNFFMSKQKFDFMLAKNQPSLAGAWAKLGNYLGAMLRAVVVKGVILRHMYDNN